MPPPTEATAADAANARASDNAEFNQPNGKPPPATGRPDGTATDNTIATTAITTTRACPRYRRMEDPPRQAINR
jgi:hypothetical protein